MFFGTISAFGSGISSVGGGGNEIGLEFKALCDEAISEVTTMQIEISTVHLQKLRAALSKVEVISVAGLQEVAAGAENQNVVAINFPDQNLVKIDSNRWLGLGNKVVKKAIALHEVESLIGYEKTGFYDLSAKYLKQSGSSTDLDADMHVELKLLTVFSAKPDFELRECRTQDLTLDVSFQSRSKTGVNQTLTTILSVRWTDEDKAFDLTNNKMRFVENSLKTTTTGQVRSITRDGDQPDSKVIDFEALNIVSTINGEPMVQQRSTGEMISKSLGIDRVQNHVIQNGMPYSDSVITKRLNQDGTKITTSENQLFTHTGSKYGAISSSAICKTTLNPHDAVVQFSPFLKRAIAKFSAAHTYAINAKIALRKCQSEKSKSDCSVELQSFKSLDRIRDQIWNQLLLE